MAEIFGDSEWMPRLVEIEYLGQTDPYFGRFGFSQLEVPHDCPLTVGLMPELTQRFNEQYGERRLGRETMERWQTALQVEFDRTVRRFERSLRIYSANQGAMDKVLGSSDTGTDTATNAGTDTRTVTGKVDNTGKTTSRFADTPDTATNASDDFGSSMNAGNSEDHQSASSSDTMAHGHVLTTTHNNNHIDNHDAVRQINASIDAWRDPIAVFIDGFDKLFLQILEY